VFPELIYSLGHLKEGRKKNFYTSVNKIIFLLECFRKPGIKNQNKPGKIGFI